MSSKDPTFPEEMIFDANLQEFANRVGIICGLESGGKISQQEAYERIRSLWKQLKKSRRNLHISEDGSSEDE